MRRLKHLIPLVLFGAALVWSSAAPSFAWDSLKADVLILGEVHDNPDHHAFQADVLERARPSAVVFEMLTPEEAAVLNAVARDARAMRTASEGFHWSNIADYADVLANSPVIIGAALPRASMRAAFSDGAAGVFGSDAALYGLDQALGAEEQAARETLQFEAHCQAMPMEMMPGMVQAQRLRDATIAQAALQALDRYGPVVAVITGNGHARKDWGVPVYLARVSPGLKIHSLGQGEAGQSPAGTFDAVERNAQTPDRGDPCAAFKS